MAQQTMYPGQANSLQTELAAAIDAVQTTITVLDGAVLPAAPNLLVIGGGEDAETVLYTGKTGNSLSGVTRGFQGTAKAWGSGVKVGRFFTAYDHDTFRANIGDHETRVSAAETKLSAATSAATANTLAQRDASGRLKAAAPSASDDVARKAETDAAATAAANAQATANSAQTTANTAYPHYGGYQYGVTTDLNNRVEKGFFHCGPGTTNAPISNAYGYVWVWAYDSSTCIQYYHVSSTDELWIRRQTAGVWYTWRKIWDSKNGGTGSGLDADTVRGKVVLPVDGSVPMTGNLEIKNSAPNVLLSDTSNPANAYRILHASGAFWIQRMVNGNWVSDILSYDPSVNTLNVPTALIKVRGEYLPGLRDNGGVLEFFTGGAWSPAGSRAVVQSGTGSTSTTTGATFTDITITTVSNVNNCLIIPRSYNNNVYNWAILNASTIRVSHTAYSGTSYVISWQIVEFK